MPSVNLLNPVRIAKFAARRAFGTIYRFRTSSRKIALTFDDGPDPNDTPKVLSCLSRHNAKATFFMVGEAVEAFPDLVQRIALEGHSLGNHTYSHISMPRHSWSSRRTELVNCQKALGNVGERFFRMPFGHQSIASHCQTVAMGYSIFGWTHKTEDTEGHTAAHMIELVDNTIAAGDIISFHDTVFHYQEEAERDRTEMLIALEYLIEKYTKLGYTFETLSTMMATSVPERTHWYRKADEPKFCRLNRKILQSGLK
jgi:peptidoglycan/xylan/chitin deacetylase (PgdA/CDA1 family)